MSFYFFFSNGYLFSLFNRRTSNKEINKSYIYIYIHNKNICDVHVYHLLYAYFKIEIKTKPKFYRLIFLQLT
jgi:hypothetical protein